VRRSRSPSRRQGYDEATASSASVEQIASPHDGVRFAGPMRDPNRIRRDCGSLRAIERLKHMLKLRRRVVRRVSGRSRGGAKWPAAGPVVPAVRRAWAVVIGADFQAHDPINRIAAPREHEDRRVGVVRSCRHTSSHPCRAASDRARRRHTRQRTGARAPLYPKAQL